MKNSVAVVQCTVSDLYDSYDPDNYCISALRESQMFDQIVLAVPEIGEYKIFDAIAKKWGVDVFYGFDFNVAERIYAAVKAYKPTIISRILLKRFYIDLELVSNMHKIIANNYDYVTLPRDVNYELSADVMSFTAFKKVVESLRTKPDEFIWNSYRMAPWFLMEQSNDYKKYHLNYKNSWDKERVKEIKYKLNELFRGNENATHVEQGNSASRYHNAVKYIDDGDKVLDIACGKGCGTVVLSEIASEVVGVDYNRDYIKNAIERKPKGIQIKYIYGRDDSVTERYRNYFDKVVSLHTLEHIEDDKAFLNNMHLCLKQNGKLILEVPRLLPIPLNEPLYPFHIREYVEDELESLIRDSGFVIESKLGGNRGVYVPISEAREVLFYVCKRV